VQISQADLDRMTDRNLSVIEYVVIHHTADSDQHKDIEEISREEVSDQGFVVVGYHAVVQADGKVQFGRPIEKVPAANLGLNTVSYAISFEGNFQPGSPGYANENPSWEQFRAAINLIKSVKIKVPSIKYLIGHRDVARITATPSNATACPGDNLYSRLHILREATGLLEK
jgi:hypothetical protein